jgi:hypothetical protein
MTRIPPEMGLVDGFNLFRMEPTLKTLNSSFATAYEKPSIETSIVTENLLKTGMMQLIVVALNDTAGCSMY